MNTAPSSPRPRAQRYAAPRTRMGTSRESKLRTFLTPEGVDLSLEIASSGLRFGALLIDLTIITLLAILTMLILPSTDNEGSLAMLVGFAVRTFYFPVMELGPRAATWGKRLVGIRVVGRDGGRLTVSAVIARNFVREMEIFLPLMVVIIGLMDGTGTPGSALLGLVWTLALSLFLLTNKDRMRLGDLIGGTWVVMARRARLQHDLIVDAPPPTSEGGDIPPFTTAELDVYGVYELQMLERVLRTRAPQQLRHAADTIRTKIGRPLVGDDEEFLLAYYRALKLHQEQGLLTGKRRADKYDSDTVENIRPRQIR